MQILVYAIVLGLVQLLLSVSLNVARRGLHYGVGPRDDVPKPLGKIASRIERAWKNFIETFPFFAASILLAHALNKSTPNSVLGAQIYIWSRVLYVPFYIFGIPWLRTMSWVASVAGIVLGLAAIWPST